MSKLSRNTVRKPVYRAGNGANRIIDANINRVKEGLRVCEEITRFILNNPKLTRDFKDIRHKIDVLIKFFPDKLVLLEERASFSDVGKKIYSGELKRKDYRDIFSANLQRVKESIRVLEEFSKLQSQSAAIRIKEVRYAVYDLEKKALQAIATLRL